MNAPKIMLTGEARTVVDFVTEMRHQAQGAHAQYPQYDGYTDGWLPVQITTVVAFKGGDLPTCFTIASPLLKRALTFTGNGVEQSEVTYVSVYNATNTHFCQVPVSAVRFI